MSKRFRVLVVFAVLLGGCPKDDSTSDDPAVIDPAMKPYGKSFAEWSAEWVQYVNAFHSPGCVNPLSDESGASCAVDQDPESPVFFLVGTFGGPAKRKCKVPAGKSLFLPMMNVWGDNAGVAKDMLLSQDEIRTYVEHAYKNVDTKRLWLKVDGMALTGLDEGGVKSAPYTIDLAKGDNGYTCQGVKGVEGKFDGQVSGYWAMLEPLPKGEHTVEFGLKRGLDLLSGDPSQPEIEISIHYTIEME
jgi:hypothetical protein